MPPHLQLRLLTLVTPAQTTLQDFFFLTGRIPRQRERYRDVALGKWLSTQFSLRSRGALKPERAAALEEVLEFDWICAEHLEGVPESFGGRDGGSAKEVGAAQWAGAWQANAQAAGGEQNGRLSPDST